MVTNYKIYKAKFGGNNNIYDIPNVPFTTLIADCEGYMETFYNEYGYEPDEQSVEIQNKLLGVLTKKININFYKKNIILIK